MYPPEKIDDAKILISLSTENLITVNGAEHLIFDGISVKGTRGNGMVINSNNVTVKNCLISELSGIGIRADGYNNLITDCEFTHIGASAVDIQGGDREKLIPGESRVENCLIHDYSEVSITEGPGVNLGGVGNICAHNEFYNAPQQAIIYGGNNLLIEYNNIHDVALLSNDCSAIYTARRWDQTGTVVRYNALYNLGDYTHTPHGIYFDDGIAGQTAYGNIILNCKGNAFIIGGGRNHNVYNNVIINCNQPFFYDDRSRTAVLDSGFWFEHSREGKDMHQNLLESPWESEAWQNAYPYMKEWSLDFSDTENSDFVANPADSKISGNIIVYYNKNIGEVADAVYEYSEISGNAFYKFRDMDKLFVDADSGNYEIKDTGKISEKIPGFKSIPFDKIGRYNR